MRLRTLLLLVFVLALLAAACGDDEETTTTAAALETIEPGILTVGSDIPYEPFEIEVEGGYSGFDVQLMDEIARRLGLETRWVDTDFDTIFTQLAQGRFDVVASATTITADRELMVNFTIPYFNSNQALTINTNETPNIETWEDLVAGDTVAVQTGTTGEIWANENLAPLGIVIRSFVQPPDCFIALEGGQVTAAILDLDPSLGAAVERPAIAVAQEIVTGEAYGFAVNPANEPLLAAINAVFTDMLEDGFYQTTYDAWIERPGASVLFGE